MKMKELKNLAQKIAKLELVIQNSDDKEEVANAEAQIIKFSGSVKTLEDMMVIDELVQEYIKNLS